MASRIRDKVMAAMMAAQSAGWARVDGRPGLTIRWDRRAVTPAWAREPFKSLPPAWDEPDYPQMVFITMLGPKSMPLLRIMHAPWVGATDQEITLRRALQVLGDPVTACGLTGQEAT